MMAWDGWLIFGLGAQLCFFLRFAVQWIASERKKESVIPKSFWYLSLAGSTGVLVYAVHISDPVFIIGQSLGFVVYMRNLILISRQKNKFSHLLSTPPQ